MSLTSLLLGCNAKIDADLNDLFKFQTNDSASTATLPSSTTREPTKRRKGSYDKNTASQPSKKRARLGAGLQTDGEKKTKTNKEKEKEANLTDIKTDYESDADGSPNLDSENPPKSTSARMASVQSWEEDDQIPVHESLLSGRPARQTKTKKGKPIFTDETPEQRNRRTIFVGNLPLEVLSKRPLAKQLQKHIISFVPTAKIESIRFRSIPFQKPVTKIASSIEGDNAISKKKEPKPHAHQRSANWRTKHGEEDVKTDEKKYLTAAQKKKIAFINQEFHSTADVVNAYIVFAHPQDATGRPANLPPLPPVMDPFHAAARAAVEANGSLFMDRFLRVDLVGKAETIVGEDELVTITEDADPRLSVFVGNLDFASKEEDLRAFFEKLMCTERGPPQEDGLSLSTRKPVTWVTRVRIVRDNTTQLGRGFAYVEFVDRVCIDEIFAMEESKLKFAKRKLRVQRCKNVPKMGQKGTNEPSSKATAAKSKRLVHLKETVQAVPGDPLLGEKLAGLSKEERKRYKSADLDRVARRFAKKKMRMAMAPSSGTALTKQRNRIRSKTKEKPSKQINV